MSAFSEKVLGLGAAVLAYWPLEAGSGADAGPNANKIALTLSGGTSEGAPLIAGGGTGLLLDGATGQATCAVPASGAGSQLNVNEPFTIFAWVAPTALPQPANVKLFGRESQWGFGLSKNLGSPLFTVLSGTSINLGVGGSDFGACPKSSGVFAGPPWPFFMCMTFDGHEFITYINGRFSRQWNSEAVFPKENKPIIVSPSAERFNGTIGHLGVIKGALTAGLVRELFLAGYLGTPPVFTDIFSLQADGIPAISTPTPGNITTATPPGFPVVAIEPAAVQKAGASAPIVGYCAAPSCGGAIRENEHVIWRTFSPGGRQPIHRSCYRVRTMNKTVPLAPNTKTEYLQATSRLMMDLIGSATFKSTDARSRYLRMNEGPLLGTGVSAGNFRMGIGSFQENYTTLSGSSTAAAILQRYYKLPRDSWCRALAELQMDQAIAQRQWKQHTLASGIHDCYGCMVDETAKPPTTTQFAEASFDNEYFFIELGKTIVLMWPYLTTSKKRTWVNAIRDLADYMVGTNFTGQSTPELYYYINGNRNMMSIFGIWLTYLVTGEQRWREHYEIAVKFLLEAITFAPESKIPAGYAAINPLIVGSSNNANGGNTAEKPNGYYFTKEGTQYDGSDSAGYIGEALSTNGTVGPSGQKGPGLDYDYGQLQLALAQSIWNFTGDIRWVRIANAMWNQLHPQIDQVGGKIAYLKPSGSPNPLGPTSTLTGATIVGATVFPMGSTGAANQGGAFVAAAKIFVGTGAQREELTVLKFNSGESVETTSGAAKAHEAGELIAQTTANNPLFEAWYFDAQRGSRHNTIIPFNNTWGFVGSWNGLMTANAPTAEELKAQWAMMEKYYKTQIQAGSAPNANVHRELADRLGAMLLGDPNFQIPLKLGA